VPARLILAQSSHKELELIVESNSLLPVLVGMPFVAFEAEWVASLLTSRLDESFFMKVARTSFIVDKGGCQGELREKIML
jgi:hypothetical protein